MEFCPKETVAIIAGFCLFFSFARLLPIHSSAGSSPIPS
jgi:hypothetical protein